MTISDVHFPSTIRTTSYSDDEILSLLHHVQQLSYIDVRRCQPRGSNISGDDRCSTGPPGRPAGSVVSLEDDDWSTGPPPPIYTHPDQWRHQGPAAGLRVVLYIHLYSSEKLIASNSELWSDLKVAWCAHQRPFKGAILNASYGLYPSVSKGHLCSWKGCQLPWHNGILPIEVCVCASNYMYRPIWVT